MQKVSYRFIAIAIKITTEFFTVLERTILKFIRNNKENKQNPQNYRIGKTIMNNKNVYFQTVLQKYKKHEFGIK